MLLCKFIQWIFNWIKGDANLPRDKFLREQIQLEDGWVPLEVLTRFNRLNKLTSDTEVIAKALLKSTSGLLEVCKSTKMVLKSKEEWCLKCKKYLNLLFLPEIYVSQKVHCKLWLMVNS